MKKIMIIFLILGVLAINSIYAIEIKTNPDNIKGKGSAIFLHCKRKEYTAGCVAIEKEDMEKLIGMIDLDTKIIIEG